MSTARPTHWTGVIELLGRLGAIGGAPELSGATCWAHTAGWILGVYLTPTGDYIALRTTLRAQRTLSGGHCLGACPRNVAVSRAGAHFASLISSPTGGLGSPVYFLPNYVRAKACRRCRRFGVRRR